MDRIAGEAAGRGGGMMAGTHTDRTTETWQTRSNRDLSREDARQIVENVMGFFSILAEWSREEMPATANDSVTTAPPAASGRGVSR